jgi:hypothetical protein
MTCRASGPSAILLEGFGQAGNGFRLHLAGGGRRVGGGQQVAHAVLPADAVEEHLSRGVHAEVAGEDLAVVGEQVLGHAVVAHGLGEGVADGRAVARATTLAETQNLEHFFVALLQQAQLHQHGRPPWSVYGDAHQPKVAKN